MSRITAPSVSIASHVRARASSFTSSGTGLRPEVAAQADAAAKAENEAEAQAVENKTARPRSLRLAREAEDRHTEPNPPALKRKRR